MRDETSIQILVSKHPSPIRVLQSSGWFRAEQGKYRMNYSISKMSQSMEELQRNKMDVCQNTDGCQSWNNLNNKINSNSNRLYPKE